MVTAKEIFHRILDQMPEEALKEAIPYLEELRDGTLSKENSDKLWNLMLQYMTPDIHKDLAEFRRRYNMK